MELKNIDLKDIQKKLKRKLSDSRYQHTLGVAFTASSLAMKYDLDINKAYIAGLLHDCAKYMDGSEMLVKAKKYHLEITEAESVKPDLLHAKLGGYFAKTKYNVEDKEVISAICNHTTGKPDMTLLEKIIYISDYIEPGRNKMPRLNVIRKTAFEEIDEALRMILEDTVSYLSKSGMYIDKKTIDTYEFYCHK